VTRQTFGEEGMSRARVFEWHAWFRADRKKAKTDEEQTQEQAHHIL
jgi:hypothetical protein